MLRLRLGLTTFTDTVIAYTMYWRGALGYDEATEVNIALSLNGLYGNDKSGVALRAGKSTI